MPFINKYKDISPPYFVTHSTVNLCAINSSKLSRIVGKSRWAEGTTGWPAERESLAPVKVTDLSDSLIEPGAERLGEPASLV